MTKGLPRERLLVMTTTPSRRLGAARVDGRARPRPAGHGVMLQGVGGDAGASRDDEGG
jgi:hypothetical protein